MVDVCGIKQNNMKAINQFAATNDLKVLTITFKSHGMTNKRKGYALINNHGHEILTFEPKNYPKGSIYERDKWMISLRGDGRLVYAPRITQTLLNGLLK